MSNQSYKGFNKTPQGRRKPYVPPVRGGSFEARSVSYGAFPLPMNGNGKPESSFSDLGLALLSLVFTQPRIEKLEKAVS